MNIAIYYTITNIGGIREWALAIDFADIGVIEWEIWLWGGRMNNVLGVILNYSVGYTNKCRILYPSC